ncbi:hypothetical protein E0Z10_g8983 [Xylaria hypoxylon]|uniref:Methyltransferase n=1 Tax=Xylaria hypoxylon TaxID=37992 RepID=A0A4Z0Y6U9_9PEZI|nr:hypothetical protein E0Z10_g8983 [Xylaria hypoxylon]
MEENSSVYRRTNQEFEDRQMIVQDARGQENNFSLDRNGFCWGQWGGPTEWGDISAAGLKEMGHEKIQQGYIKAVERFIKGEVEEQDGETVEFVKVFDYKLQSSSDMGAFYKKNLNPADGLDTLIPVTHPHVDQSFDGAVARLHAHFGDDVVRLLKRRFRIINVWKPLSKVENWPLALCDSASVDFQDLIATDTVRRKYVGETFYSTFNPKQLWYYLSNQKRDEVAMLKIYDSNESATARFNLHSSFCLPDAEGWGERESFEIRAFVFDREH